MRPVPLAAPPNPAQRHPQRGQVISPPMRTPLASRVETVDHPKPHGDQGWRLDRHGLTPPGIPYPPPPVPIHPVQPEAVRMPRPGGTTARGYGSGHRRLRAQLLPLAIGTACPMCGQVMGRDQPLDLDHTTPQALGGGPGRRIVHARCNRQAGARLGNQLRRATTPSREW